MLLNRPWLTPVIVVFWAISMKWLVTAKIMPSLAAHAPPGQQALYATNNELVPVAWTVLWNDAPVGYAVSRSERQPDNGLVVESLLHFDFIPIDEMIPAWLRMMAPRQLPDQVTVPFNARGKLSIDSRGELRSFRSTVGIPGVTDRTVLSGTVHGGRVSVAVDTHGMRYEGDRELPEGMTVGDELSPQATMPGLSVGRRWTVPTYSPLRPGSTPIEILHAEVAKETTFFWSDHLVRVHEVTYRDDPTAPHHEPRFTMLVDMDGRVLKQDSVLLGARLTFVRRDDDSASRLVEELDAPEPDYSKLLDSALLDETDETDETGHAEPADEGSRETPSADVPQEKLP